VKHLGEGGNAHGPHLCAVEWVTDADVTRCEWEKCEQTEPPKLPARVCPKAGHAKEENSNNKVCLGDGHQLD